MDNIQLPDFNVEFDFQNDFTDGENSVINQILTNPIESTELFEADDTFSGGGGGGGQFNSSSFLEYLCQDSSTFNDDILSHHFSGSESVTYDSGFTQVGYELETFATDSSGMDAVAADQNFDFDWTTFLDESSQESDNPSKSVSPTYDVQNSFQDNENVICDNGFVYQELKTLDVPQLYSDLNQTFDLTNMKEYEQSIDYSTLADQNDADDEKPIIEHDAPIMNQKVFLMPFEMNESGTQSLYQIATKLKDDPTVMNSMLNQCQNKEQNTNILIPSRPKQIKQKTDRYQTVSEQLNQIKTKEIVLPPIGRKSPRKARKQTPKIDMGNGPVTYSFEIVLHDVMTDGTFNRFCKQKTSMKSPKKSSPSSRPVKSKTKQSGSNDPRSSRRISQKPKTT